MKKFTAVLLTALLLCLVACDGIDNSLPVSSSYPSSSDINSSEKPSSDLSSKEESSSAPSSSDLSSSMPSSLPSSSDINSSLPSSSVPSSSAPSSSQVSSSTPSAPDRAPEETPSIHKEHYCYSNLTSIQKQYYNSMHTAVEDMFTSWVVLGKLGDNYTNDIAVARHALVSDHPDVFWLPPYYITATGKDANGNPAALMMFSSSANIQPAFLVKRSEKDVMAEELMNAVLDITSQVTATDPFEIELQLHDLLCQRVEYSDNTADSMIYSAYGALVNGRALCEGYSKAMQLLLHQFDIPCITVTGVTGGENGEGHMWNQVYIGGNWYNLDVTWNDSSKDFISHEYFNLTDADISLDHAFSKDFYELADKEQSLGSVAFNLARPVCESNTYNYFTQRGFFFSAENTPDLVNYIINTQSEVIEVRFSNTSFRDTFNKNAEEYLEEINAELTLQSADIDYYIGGYSTINNLTLKLYKTKNP